MMLTYKEFSNLVPKETKELVDDFLKKLKKDVPWINYNKNTAEVCDMHIYPEFAFMAYMYLNDEKTKAILHNEGYEINTFKSIFDEKTDEQNIEKYFSQYSSLFCLFDDEYRYSNLTPQHILLKNIAKLYNIFIDIFDYDVRISPPLLESIKTWNCDSDKLEVIQGKYETYVEQIYYKIYENLKNEIISNLPMDTISYLVTVSAVHKKICNKNISNDVLVAVLLISLFYNKNSNYITNYFNSIGITEQKVMSIINDIEICKNISDRINLSDANEDFNIIKCYYSKFLNIKEKSNLQIHDIISTLIDTNISESYLFLQILNVLNIPIDKFQNLEEELNQYKENKKKFEENKILKVLHDNFHIKTVEYIKYISCIYGMLDEKNKANNFKTTYDNLILIKIAIFASIYRYDNNIASYFIDNGVTLNKFLEYYNLTLEDLNLKNIKPDIKYIRTIDNVLKNGHRYYVVENINDIIINLYESDHIRKFLKDINQNIDVNNLEKSINHHISIRKKERIQKQLKKVYTDLDINVIKFIELCSINYKDIFDTLKGNYSENDILEITILLSFIALNTPISEYLNRFYFNLCPNDSFHFSNSYICPTRLERIYNSDIFNSNIDVNLIKNKLTKYIFGGRNKDKKRNEIEIIDIVNNIFNKELNYSMNLKEFLNKYNLNYDSFDCNLKEKYNEYNYEIQKSEIRNIMRSYVPFEYIDNVYKIYRIIADNNKKLGGPSNYLAISSIIYLFYSENDIVDFFVKRNLTLERILEYLNVPKDKIDKFETLQTDFDYIHKNIYYSLFDYDQYGNIKYIFENLKQDHFNTVYQMFYDLLHNDYNILKQEIMTKQHYISREEKLEKYSQMPVPKLEIDNIENISNFGNILAEQSEFIATDYSNFIESKEENQEIAELQTELKQISKKDEKSNGIFSFLSRKKDESQIKYNKKEVLDKLDNYLKSKEQSLKKGLIELQHIRKSIGVYLNKANSYLETLNESKKILSNEIANKNYVENDFRIFDDNLRMQLLDDKISSINASIIQMLQQYQKITLQMSTHASLINHINISRSTQLQNIYLEMTINEGILKEKESIDSLNGLMGLLNNMSIINKQNMVQNIEAINELCKTTEHTEIAANDKILMEQILQEQNVAALPNDDKEKVYIKK